VIYGVGFINGKLWMFFGAFCLFWWIVESPNHDLAKLVELVLQVSELMEAFGVLM